MEDGRADSDNSPQKAQKAQRKIVERYISKMFFVPFVLLW